MLDIKKIKTPSLFSKETIRKSWKAMAMLLLGIVLSIGGSIYIQNGIEQQSNREFTVVCSDIREKMTAQLILYAQLSRNGAALFAASDTVTRSEWATFVTASKLEKNLPFIQGFGFSLIIPNNQLQQHLKHMRQKGYPDYTIFPAGNRDSYTSIIYMEPFSGINLSAFGYDMFTDSVRREAMELARDEDVVALSGKVPLIQETEKNAQPGTLMYVPVYKNGMPTNTVAQRRAAIKGWVYSPYRMKDLMQQILGRWDIMQLKKIHLQVYDDSISKASFLYNSQSMDSSGIIQSPNNSITLPVAFKGKKWVVVFNQYGTQMPYLKSMGFIVLISGISISLTLFLFFVSILNTKRRAQQIAQDLTVELKENVDKYKNLSSLMESIMDTVPGPIFYKDKSNNYIQINKAIAVANGKTKDEIVGKNLAELYSKEVAEKYYQDDLEVLHSGIPKLNIEEPWETKEGLKWLTTSKIPFVNAEGNIIGVIGMSMDITQRKQLEMEREQFLKFFQISTDIMVIADTNGFFKKINSACLQMLGYTEKELLAKQFIDFVHPDDRPTTLNELANQIKTGHSINFENRYICKDGTTKVLSWQAAYNANDKLTYATARDITERKLAEVQILDLNKELAKKVQVQSIQNEMVNKELDSFTFSVSHDMRAPLRAINSYAQIITEEHSKQLNADGMQMLENIKYNGIKMGRLIDDLLAFSRLGRKELLKSPVNMHELTKLVVKDLNIALPNHATIQVGKLPEVMGDYNLLYQAMYHLVSNAIKYAGKKQNPLIEITATQKEGKDIISIKDNGAGFDMRFSKKLFGVFQRLHSESEFEGNGIGLALVHRIITKHGGTVWGEGKVNEGATFYFTLN